MKKVLVVINKDINSGPNFIAKGVISDEYDSLFLHVFREKGLCLLSCFINLLRRIRLKPYNIVHSHSFYPDLFSGLASLLNFRLKHISTIHNLPNEDYIIRYGKIKGYILLLSHYFIYIFLTNKVICISKSVQDSLPYVIRRKSIVIYNYISEDFKPTKDYSENNKIFYCGHFSKLKKPDFIIKNVMHSDFDFIFRLFGEGELKEKCQKMVENDSRFIFEGRRNDVSKFYYSGSLLIHSSNTEGFCLSVVEALASNMKVLVPNLSVFLEMKYDLGLRNIFIYEQGNSASFKSNLNEAIKSSVVVDDKVKYFYVSRFKSEHYKIYDELIS